MDYLERNTNAPMMSSIKTPPINLPTDGNMTAGQTIPRPM